jgi:hypothetical protein
MTPNTSEDSWNTEGKIKFDGLFSFEASDTDTKVDASMS